MNEKYSLLFPNDLGLTAPPRPEDSYVEILDSAESTYYHHGHSYIPAGPMSNCSEYSCYSVTASGNHVIVDPRTVGLAQSQCSSSFAVYTDSDNCSALYGPGAYHNGSHPPLQRMQSVVGVPLQTYRSTEPFLAANSNLKRFGDTMVIGREANGGNGRPTLQGNERMMQRPDLVPLQVLKSGGKAGKILHVSPSTTDT